MAIICKKVSKRVTFEVALTHSSMATAAKPKIIGKVTHYYDDIGVGVLELKKGIKVGDDITIKRGDQEYTQTVESMQVDHESVEKAKKGQDVGLKLNEKTKEGALVLAA